MRLKDLAIRSRFLAAGAILFASFLPLGIATAITNKAQAECDGGAGTFYCSLAGFEQALVFLLLTLLCLLVAGLLVMWGTFGWLLAKHRAQVAEREVRRLEREVAKLEKELGEGS